MTSKIARQEVGGMGLGPQSSSWLDGVARRLRWWRHRSVVVPEGLPPRLVEQLSQLEGVPSPIASLVLNAVRPGSRAALLTYGLAEEAVAADSEERALVLTKAGRSVVSAAARQAAARREMVREPLGPADLGFLRAEPLGAPSGGAPGGRSDFEELPTDHLESLAQQAAQNEMEMHERLYGQRCYRAILRSRAGASLDDIVRTTGLSASTVENVVPLLDKRGLTVTGHDPEGAGDIRHVNEAQHRAIGIQVRPDEVFGVLTDLRAVVVASRRTPLPHNDPSTVVEAIRALSSELASLHEDCEILGIGVQLGGHIDGRTGQVRYSPNLGDWRNIDLDELLRDATSRTVAIDNDANSLACYEQWFGDDAIDENWFAVILISEGIGCGLIEEAHLVRGSSGSAGELGHLPLAPEGPACPHCGGRNCLESVASTRAIVGAVQRVKPTISTIEEAAVFANSGNRTAQAAFSEAGRALGRGVSTLLKLHNPARIIFFGPPEIAESEETAANLYRNGVEEVVTGDSFSTTADDCKRVWLPTAEFDGARGAAAILLKRFMDRPLAWD